jgi:hypothetical protein
MVIQRSRKQARVDNEPFPLPGALKERRTMGWLRIIDREGDRQIEWQQSDPESLVRAEQEIAKWLEQPGHLAFGFRRSRSEAGEKLFWFDSTLYEILLVPQMRGGEP